MKRGKICRYFRDRVCTLKAKILTVKDGVARECEDCPRRTK